MSAERTIEYWDLEEPLYGNLHFTAEDDAMEMILDSFFPDPLPRRVTLYGWARRELERRDVELAVGAAEEYIWERLDEEYGNPDGSARDSEPTPEHEAAIAKAKTALVDAIRAGYPVLGCEIATEKEIDCEQWVRENAPHWMKSEDWSGFAPEEEKR